MIIPHMIPYAQPLYFLYLFLALLPVGISLWFGKRLRLYEALLTVFFLWISFGGEFAHQGLALIGYVFYQCVLVGGYFAIKQKKNSTPIFYLAVCLAILPLAITKVVPFFTAGKPSILGFLGISYLTFRSVQMIMETRDGLIKEYSWINYLRFLLFFPTISSGPIDRYRRFLKDEQTVPERVQYVELLGKGIHSIMMGFLYKFIIGYYLGTVLLPIVSERSLVAGGLSWSLVGYMYVYSLYLFFDFAGYSLFAVGTSYIMGYNVPVNFNKPFLSPNIKEFWNRWHMSLSFWFRDYVYMRLMFTLMKKKVFKSRIVSSNVGYFALFLLMGVWHGLTWYYLLYGVYHAAWICLNDAWIRYKKKHKNLPSNRLTYLLAIFLTFNGVCISFLIFSGFLDTLFFK
ncbi:MULTISPECIES: D-alanyl-lipoteichoic acid biosynthesis protein DltB [Enterococcus]|uniref:Teichoic acid D-alanyltransferase n=1 Tax=Enterococcus sulfureus ATCC 49903 TaxID=1140003 RepID=S0L3J6_9ENTE|nr:D-alanyl-lipoteichoic acid biosynthesis protein DltB [Enterococcus sulfureus]EOT51427.1 D-alanyl-lipoteichoic acid biosynthesis protein DltB [Enterococcus sulfureus ATCC 49903]EOT87084.1 D-alanyl-lipoteichoic acid biosynthesis protein DltB [Enterococcus sulfureus ATCC 49903]